MSVRRASPVAGSGVADGGAPEDGILGGAARIGHADGCVQLALEEVAVQPTRHAPSPSTPRGRTSPPADDPDHHLATLPELWVRSYSYVLRDDRVDPRVCSSRT